MRSYYRVMLGKQSMHAPACFAGNFIGVDFEIPQDLTADLSDDWREFNAKFIPIFQAGHPGKTKIAAGLACGFLWTVSKGILIGDIVLCPDGARAYRIAEVAGDYFYAPGQILPHRRPVKWLPRTIDRAAMSDSLKRSAGSAGTVSNISGHRDEIEKLLSGAAQPSIVALDETIEDPTVFALEKHLEDFLVENWAQTILGKDYDIFEDDGQKVGQQFQTDTGPMDVLAIRKDKKELVVVELKKGRASDVVVGQVLRYMGFVAQELAEPDQSVRGVIIALDEDQRIRRALAVSPNIDFYRYQVSFKLQKV